MVLTETLIEGIGLSIFFVASIVIISLLGILIFGRYDKRCLKKENSYFLIILIILLIHILLDTIIQVYPNDLMIKFDVIWNFVLLFSFLIIFYLLWRKLDKFWVSLSLLSLVICVCVDILRVFYQHVSLLQITHFLSILGLFIGVNFLVVKFLIDYSGGHMIKC